MRTASRFSSGWAGTPLGSAHEASTPSRSRRRSQCRWLAWCSWITNRVPVAAAAVSPPPPGSGVAPDRAFCGSCSGGRPSSLILPRRGLVHLSSGPQERVMLGPQRPIWSHMALRPLKVTAGAAALSCALLAGPAAGSAMACDNANARPGGASQGAARERHRLPGQQRPRAPRPRPAARERPPLSRGRGPLGRHGAQALLQPHLAQRAGTWWTASGTPATSPAPAAGPWARTSPGARARAARRARS